MINLHYIDHFQITLYKNIQDFNKYFLCINIKFQWHNYLNIGHIEILQVKPFIFIHITCKHYLRSNNHINQQQLSKIKDFTNVIFNKQVFEVTEVHVRASIFSLRYLHIILFWIQALDTITVKILYRKW